MYDMTRDQLIEIAKKESGNPDLKIIEQVKMEAHVKDLETLDRVTEILATEAEANPNTQTLRNILNGERQPSTAEPRLGVMHIDDSVGISTDYKLTAITTETGPSAFALEHKEISKASRLSEINDDEAMTLFNIMTKYKADENFNVYEALPIKIKGLMKLQAKQNGLTSPKQLNKFSKIMLEQMITEANLDKEFDSFQSNLSKELAIPSVIDMYAEHTRSLMEEGLEKKAKALEAQYPDKAEELRKISKAFTDSYTLVRQKALLESDPKVIDKMVKNTGKYFNRICDYFDFKLSKSKFKVKSVKTLIPALRSIFPITDDMARRYVVVLCLTCENMSHENIDDVWFMYHSVNTIISLSCTTKDKTEFSKLVLSNIGEFIEIIRSAEDLACEV